MRKFEFSKLPEYNSENEDNMNELEVGDNFLFGISVISQKQNKQVGHAITYYQVVRKWGNGIEYTPIFDYLENDYKGE